MDSRALASDGKRSAPTDIIIDEEAVGVATTESGASFPRSIVQ
jgi:hypothetical protein